MKPWDELDEREREDRRIFGDSEPDDPTYPGADLSRLTRLDLLDAILDAQTMDAANACADEYARRFPDEMAALQRRLSSAYDQGENVPLCPRCGRPFDAVHPVSGRCGATVAETPN